ncbi:class I SAM-dependent methyltransferase [Patescibacteria group bacterium]|nr:class I SAM-dependent methyltransferase [Patescibacteria group bacterium]
MTEDYIVGLFEKYKDYIDIKYLDGIFNKPIVNGKKRGISIVDALILYLLIIDNNPSHIIELGAETGFSTNVIALALRKLDKKKCFTTFEANVKHQKPLMDRLAHNKTINFVNIHIGHAEKDVVPYLQDKSKVDFCFIDCCHSKEFGKWYTEKLMPLLSPNCIVAIHDIASNKDGKPARNCKGKLYEEWEVVRNWLKEQNYDYILTHYLFGGKFEMSPNLPVNTDLYNKISNIISIDLLSYINIPPLIMITNRTRKENNVEKTI